MQDAYMFWKMQCSLTCGCSVSGVVLCLVAGRGKKGGLD
jgi:hypothetical protein